MNFYKLNRTTRILIALFSAAVLIFFAGALFNGAKPTATNVLVMVLAALNLISFTFTRPNTPPPQI